MHTIESQKPVSRECGSCNVCCHGWLEEKVNAKEFYHELKFGSPCPAVRSFGCGIYEARPEHPCRTFKCGCLVEGSPFPDEYRPDKVGVIIVQLSWRNKRAWVLATAGKAPDEAMREFMRKHTISTGEPHMIKDQQKLLCFGKPEFQADMLGVPVVRPKIFETTALGAAFLAGLATGFWKNREQLASQWQIDRTFEPSMPKSKVEALRHGWNKALERSREWELG